MMSNVSRALLVASLLAGLIAASSVTAGEPRAVPATAATEPSASSVCSTGFFWLTTSVDPGGFQMGTGSSQNLAAKVTCDGQQDVTTDPLTKITWSIQGDDVGTLSSTNGTPIAFQAVRPGSAQVVALATYRGLAAEARANVVVGGGGSCARFAVHLAPVQWWTSITGSGPKSQQFRALPLCNGSNVTGSSQFAWSVDGPQGLGTVDNASGWTSTFTAKNVSNGRMEVATTYGNMAGTGRAPVVVAGLGTGGNPTVTGTIPTGDGAGVPVNSSIEFAFNTEMDKAPTQNAVFASPPIPGVFSWTNPDKDTRLVWDPSGALAGNTRYTVTVSTAAKSSVQVNMKRAYTFNFTTGNGSAAPQVVSTAPSDGTANVSANSTLVIDFSERMQQGPTQSAVSAVPAISGNFAWSANDTRLALTPSAPLQSGMQYSVTVSTGAVSQAGVPMSSPYPFKFTTAGPPPPPAPQVVSTDPKDGANGTPLNTHVFVTFSQAMDTGPTEAAFSATPNIAGSFQAWTTGDTVMHFAPSAPLQPSTWYTVTIGTGAKSKAGASLPSAFTFSFTAADIDTPAVVETSPRDGDMDVPVSTNIVVRFSIPMDPVSVEGSLAIDPPTNRSLSWSGGDTTLTVNPEQDLAGSTKYTIEIANGAKSAKGVPMSQEYIFSFTTVWVPPPPVPPRVVAVDPPGDGTDVTDLGTSITVVFDIDMKRPETEKTFSIAPFVSGTYAWPDARKLVYDPLGDLASATTYKVSVGGVSAVGIPMATPYTWSFPTVDLPPKIEHSPPGEAVEGSDVEIRATVKDDGDPAKVGATLLWRTTGQAAPFEQEPMVPLGNGEFSAPVRAVQRPGVEYYIRAGDAVGVDRATSPSGAPPAVHSFPVRAKSAIPGGDVQVLGVPAPLLLLAGAAAAAAGALIYARRRRRARREEEDATGREFFGPDAAAAAVRTAEPSEPVMFPKYEEKAGAAGATVAALTGGTAKPKEEVRFRKPSEFAVARKRRPVQEEAAKEFVHCPMCDVETDASLSFCTTCGEPLGKKRDEPVERDEGEAARESTKTREPSAGARRVEAAVETEAIPKAAATHLEKRKELIERIKARRASKATEQEREKGG